MAKQFNLRKKLILFLLVASVSPHLFAAAFQLWGLDAASIGNYHAERAAITEDASTSYYNPAGLVQIKNQQFVGGIAPTATDIRFRGTEAVNTLASPGPKAVSAQGGSFKLLPFGHYAAPISDRVVFGLSLAEPFGFKTNYGNSTPLRYTSTLNTLDVYDLSPSLGIVATDKLSLGLGLDFQRLTGEFDYATTAVGAAGDTLSTNTGNDWGYGYHLGALYQFTPSTRVGLSYHSQVVHQLSGTSKFIGSLTGASGSQYSSLKARITLPPTTTFSAFHTINSSWDVMGSVSYTQWSVSNNMMLKNVGGIKGGALTNNLRIPLIRGYSNSWNYSVGANYHINDKMMLRTGVGYDKTPSDNSYRNVQLPDSNLVAVALGGHIQATDTLGCDIGWTHVFAMNTRVNNVSQVAGDQIATTNGSVQQNSDVYGLQVKWDIL